MLDLTTAGNSVPAFKKALNGNGRRSTSSDGAIKGINLAQSLRSAKSMFSGGKRESEQAAAGGEKTDFSELSASFDHQERHRPQRRSPGEIAVPAPDRRRGHQHPGKQPELPGEGGRGREQRRPGRQGSGRPQGIDDPGSRFRARSRRSSTSWSSAARCPSRAKQQLEEKKESLKSKLEDKLKSKLLGGSTTNPAGRARKEARRPKARRRAEAGRQAEAETEEAVLMRDRGRATSPNASLPGSAGPGATTCPGRCAMPIASGCPRSCCSRPRSRRSFPISCGSSSVFPASPAWPPRTRTRCWPCGADWATTRGPAICIARRKW